MHIKLFSILGEAIQWVNTIASRSIQTIPKQKKLEKIIRVLKLFDNPHLSFKSIHITGSKGKSSTAKACAYFLHNINYKVGLFTSPHIHSYNERIQINNQAIEDPLFLSTLNQIYQTVLLNTLSLTMFEILTVAACLIFKLQKIDFAIFEVGIGGRYDTTNFLSPALSIITNIELEHTNILGNSLEEITYDKAGIIKHKTPIWIGEQSYPQVVSVLQKYAQAQDAPCFIFSEYVQLTHTHGISQKLLKTTIKSKPAPHNPYKHWNGIQITSSTLSHKILEDQILADIAIHTFLNRIPTSSLRVYNADIQLPCRSELISERDLPNLFLDGAHTKNSMSATMSCLQTLSTRIVIVFALSKEKDHTTIITLLAEYRQIIEHIIVTQAGNFRENSSQQVFNILHPYFQNIDLVENEQDALELATKKTLNIPLTQRPLIAVLGSFYLCADCRSLWLNKIKTRKSK